MGVDILKASGALLIINSHLELLYPQPWMSADGLLGNTLFFLITGYTLAGSIARRPDESLLAFLKQRLLRLYPAVWIVLLLLPPLPPDLSSFAGAASSFIYPTQFTFVRTVIPLYPFLYLLLRHVQPGVRATTVIVIVLCGIAATSAYIQLWSMEGQAVALSQLDGRCWVPYYAAAVTAGALMWKVGAPLAGMTRARLLTGTFLSLILAYYALRFGVTGAAPEWLASCARLCAFLILPLCLALATLSLPVCCTPNITNRALKHPLFAGAISFLSAHTWEAYLLHVGVSHWRWITQTTFPVNVLLVFALTLMMAPLLRQVSNPQAYARRTP